MDGLRKFFRSVSGRPSLFPLRASPASSLAETARMMFELSGNAALVADIQGNIAYINEVAERFTGVSAAAASGKPLAEIVLLSNHKTGENIDIPLHKVLIEARAMFLPDHTSLSGFSQQRLPVDGSLGPVFASDGRVLGAILLLHDVSRYRLLTDALFLQANQDSLTGLVNRREFETRVARALKKVRAHKGSHALAYLDLDKFKIVNDLCGHGAGDELLRRAAAALRAKVRDRDTIARLGGDEFGLLLENCTLETAKLVCGNLLEAVKDISFAWQGRTFTVGLSIGLLIFDDKSEDVGTLMAAADAACYRAKENGRQRIEIHNSKLTDFHVAGERSGIARIVSALDENRFILFAQPIVPASADKTSGELFEILAKMVSPKGVPVDPCDFLPAVERYHLMPTLDRWIIRHAFEAHSKIYQGDDRPSTWCLNLSASSLISDGFAAFISDEAERCNVPPTVICFEIAETITRAKNSRSADFIWAMKIAGFRFCIDDFGKSLDSLVSLKSLPIDFLKIDGDFIKDMLIDDVALGMVEAIHNIGQIMGIKTIAEYVESQETFERVKSMGIDFAQGYACGLPAPIADLSANFSVRNFSVSKTARGSSSTTFQTSQ